MKKIILVIGVLALTGFTTWWLQDAPLDDAARQWLDTTPSDDNPAYAYLLGFGAPADQSPARQGQALAQRQKNHPDLPLPNSYRDLNASPLLCRNMDASCLLQQQEKRVEAEALVNRYQFLIDRYQTFLGFAYFSDNTPPRLDATFPEYSLLITASRLQSLAWALSNAPEKNIDREIQQLRHWLAQDHSLISKMIANAMLAEKLQLTALLVQQGKMPTLRLAPLTTAEKSFQAPLQKEFAMMAHFFIDEQYRDGNEAASWIEEIQFRAGLKKHISVNRMLPLYQHYAQLAEQPVDAIEADQFHPDPASMSEAIRNPIGNVLLETASPDFKQYLLRLVHLDARMALLKQLEKTETDNPVNNPWTPGKEDTLTRRDKQLCFRHAPDHDRYNSCLPLL
ncbi:MAG TPA: hypothetical protein EYG20_08955 [Alcanivorax sp.]|uniref:hypothetical protein n=1 Tax=uncultured Alcanivorax sp. TaxID=191215 RepID=UPI001A15F0AD|nr:hypothetical protein [Alcanivorax sp.]